MRESMRFPTIHTPTATSVIFFLSFHSISTYKLQGNRFWIKARAGCMLMRIGTPTVECAVGGWGWFERGDLERGCGLRGRYHGRQFLVGRIHLGGCCVLKEASKVGEPAAIGSCRRLDDVTSVHSL